MTSTATTARLAPSARALAFDMLEASPWRDPAHDTYVADQARMLAVASRPALACPATTVLSAGYTVVLPRLFALLTRRQLPTAVVTGLA